MIKRLNEPYFLLRIARDITKSLLGPILCFHFFRLSGRGLSKGRYPTVEEAEKRLPKKKKAGYDHPDMGEYYQQRIKNSTLQNYDYPVLFFLSKHLKDNIKIFDLGGNVGVHYHLYSKFLSYPKSLTWTVCDLPKIIQYADKKNNSQLRFTTDFNSLDSQDIMIAQGVIQYIDNFSLATIKNRPEVIIINRMPLIQKSEKFVSVQNGGVGAYFVPIINNKEEFINSIEKFGYSLVNEWVVWMMNLLLHSSSIHA